jgi:iron complex outermembrane receptor protein
VNVLVDQRNTNLAATKQNGIDATISYNHQFGELAVNASAAASWTISDKEQVAKGQPFTDRLGFYNTPIEWRGRGSFGMLWRGFSGNLFVNYTGAYTNDLAIDNRNNTIAPQKVGSWTTFDLTLGYGTEFKSPALGLLKGLRASLTLQNLFDRDPPTVITSQGAFNGAYSNPFGRTYTAQVTLNF